MESLSLGEEGPFDNFHRDAPLEDLVLSRTEVMLLELHRPPRGKKKSEKPTLARKATKKKAK